MILEEIEYNDWKITSQDNMIDRYQKSISSYYLNNWYEKVKDITFRTYIYKNLDEILEILPFEKCIVRYENKSPKDSEYWKPISTKTELINIFHTSLRSKTNAGDLYCVREYKELGSEYRCFWNNGLVAISSEDNFQENNCVNEIIKYIESIRNYIPYHRCVFDIAELKNETNSYILIEFNSWESNSGAHRFDWSDDTEIFYSTERYDYIINKNDITTKCICLYRVQSTEIRWQNFGCTIQNPNADLYVAEKYYDVLNVKDLFDIYEIVDDYNYINTLFTPDYIYCSNDVWLGKFDRYSLDLKDFVRGVFRFDQLNFCSDGKIYDGANYYYSNLVPFKKSQYERRPTVINQCY